MLKLYENIKKRRLELNMTQQELAEALGYKSGKSMIAKIEAGQVDINQGKILKFAEALNCTPSCLMGWEDNENYQAIAQMQSDTIAYEDRIINQLKEQLDDLSIDSLATLNDILKLNLSPPEWSDLEKYAEFVKSRRI